MTNVHWHLMLLATVLACVQGLNCTYTIPSTSVHFVDHVQQFLANHTNPAPSSITVCVPPGTYTGCGLGINMYTSGGVPANLVGLTSGATKPHVNCTGTGRVFYITNSTTVTVANMSFSNGQSHTTTEGGILYTSSVVGGVNVTLLNVDVSHTVDCAVYVAGSGSSLKMRGGEYALNSDATEPPVAWASNVDSALIENTAFLSNTGTAYAAVRLQSTVSVVVRGIYGFGNDGGMGGTLLTSSCDNVDLSDSVFEANSCTADGAGTHFDETAFTVTITNCSFTGNTADGNGGGVYVYHTFDDTNVVLVDGTFRENAANEGGGMHLDEMDSSTLHNSTFTNNTSTYGGGLLVQSDYLTIGGCHFKGGGLAAPNPAIGFFAYLSDSTFVGNTAEDSGGGAAFYRRGVISNCDFQDNDSNNQGGSLYTFWLDGYIYNVNINNSRSGLNSALMLARDNNYLENITITNVVGDGGGAMMLETSSVIAHANNITIRNVGSLWDGGAIYNDGYLFLNDSLIENAWALGNGGAIESPGQEIQMHRVTVINCTSTGYGGGIAAWTTSTLTDVTVTNCTGLDGGGMVVRSTVIQRCVVTENTAESRGGGVFALGLPVRIDNTTIAYNDCPELLCSGGGMFVDATDVTGSRVTIVGNRAHTEGGGVSTNTNTGASVMLVDSEISGNSAERSGGVHNTRANTVELVNVNIKSNTAQYTGGGVSSEDATAILSSCRVQSNTVTLFYGGGAFFVRGVGVIRNSTFVNNVAAAGGGAVAAVFGASPNITNTAIHGNSGGIGSALLADNATIVVNTSDITCNVASTELGGAVAALDVAASVAFGPETVVAHNYWLQSGELPRPPALLVYDLDAGDGRISGYTALFEGSNLNAVCPALPVCNESAVCNGGACSLEYAPAAATVCNCTGLVYGGGLTCTFSICMDGLLAPDEACDDGNGNDVDACSNNCTLNCGNGAVDSLEECDDGNRANGDSCNSNCLWSCGDGFVNTTAGEECDDGNRLNGDACDSNCSWSCGNGFVNTTAGEECDDGNTLDGDACDSNCSWSCGNGHVNYTAGEECDDGNRIASDECSNNCTLNCGNGELDGTEECDDADTDDDNYCHNDCTLNTGWGGGGGVCGDGVWNRKRGEQCDDGNGNNNDACRNDCTRRRPRPDSRCASNEWRRKTGCEPCPEGGYCDGSTWCLPLKGYWSKSPYHVPIRCGVYDACPGVVTKDGDYVDGTTFSPDGNPVTTVCSRDYGDEVCAKCKPRRFKDNQRCVPCPGAIVSTTSGLIIVFSAVIVVVAIAVVVLNDKSLDLFVAGLLSIQMFVLVGRDASRFVSGSIGGRAAAAYRYLSVITFDVEFLQLGCARGRALDFVEVFWGTVALVVIAYTVFVAAAAISVALRFYRGKLVMGVRESLYLRVVHVTVLLGVAAYVQVALRAIQAVDCLEIEGEPRLRVELSTRCYTPSHGAAATVAWITMVAYLLGFPVFVFFVAWSRPALLKQRKSALSDSSLALGVVGESSDLSASGSPSSSTPGFHVHNEGSGSGSDHWGWGRSGEQGSSVVERSESESEQQSESSGTTASTTDSSGGSSGSDGVVLDKATIRELFVYRSKYGFLIRNLHRHAYWYQALRLAVLFVIVLELVTPHSVSTKLFGGVIILCASVVVVGLVWPFKNRLVNLFQMGSGVVTAFQTVLFLQGVVDPRDLSTLMFVLSLIAVVIVCGVMIANFFYNKSLLLICTEAWAPTDSTSAWSLSFGTSSSASASHSSSRSTSLQSTSSRLAGDGAVWGDDSSL